MSRIRELLMGSGRRRELNSNQSKGGFIYTFVVRKPNNKAILPYCLYPIISASQDRSRPVDFTHKHPDCPIVSKTSKTEEMERRPHQYQKLSLHRAKAKQLSSYGTRAFSLSREEWKQQQILVRPAKRHTNTYFKTTLVQKLQPEYSDQYRFSSEIQKRKAKKGSSPKRRLSDRRNLYHPRPLRSSPNPSESPCEVFELSGWETSQGQSE